ncbi:MAG: hypothetical protein JWM54_2197 [Acidobacteriaceae bacterium]|nr:hypothetical protein [Acidobacteriaceae bacterium]
MSHHAEGLRCRLTRTIAVLGILLFADGLSDGRATRLESTVIDSGHARLGLIFDGPPPVLPAAAYRRYVQQAADAVSLYYGHFPVPFARVVLQFSANRDGILQGTTWGDVDGVPAITRLRVGQRTSAEQLERDWIATHELVHTALPSLPDDQHWLEEGIASYVEPVARVQAGLLTTKQMWRGMVTGMPNGEPESGDKGLNRTHTWGRTYWGGAMFCLVADVEIRRHTGNARGLQDALRAIVNAGGTIDKEWPIGRILDIGDRATGTTVLHDTYQRWSENPVNVDLAELWRELGVEPNDGEIAFNDQASLASARKAITAVPKQ